jgi:hypothetical protein
MLPVAVGMHGLLLALQGGAAKQRGANLFQGTGVILEKPVAMSLNNWSQIHLDGISVIAVYY